MAIELTANAKNKSEAIEKKIQIVLELEGDPNRHVIGVISEYVRVGAEDLEIGDDWRIGGLVRAVNQIESISLDGTTTTIAQQLVQDKGGATSVPSIQISLLDRSEDGNPITQLITPGVIIPEIIGVKAIVSVGYEGTAFPQDFIRVFNGVVDEYQGRGNIILNVSGPEQRKRSKIFPKFQGNLADDADFKSKTIQSIRYKTRYDVATTVTIEYRDDGTAGSEAVDVVGSDIIIHMESGVSSASQIRNAVESKQEAVALVSTSVVRDESATVQTSFAAVPLGSDTTLTLESTEGLLTKADNGTFRTYVRINDEVIEYEAIVGDTLTGCTREAFVATNPKARGDQHILGDQVESFYRLSGNAIDLALKLLLSGGPEYFAEGIAIASFVDIETVGLIPNAIYFPGHNIQDEYGIVVGDIVTTIDDTYAENNVTEKLISSIVKNQYGSYLVIADVNFTANPNSTATISFKSKYNVLPQNAGCELGGDQVDVPEFERVALLFNGSIFTYDRYLKDTIDAKDEIDQKILFPTGAFSIPRKGKISLGFSSPPIGSESLKKFDSNNTSRPTQNNIVRGISNYFYNTIAFKFNEDVLEEKFLSGEITTSGDSRNRIKLGQKTFTIEAPGLRPGSDTTAVMESLVQRFLDRFKFGAERIKSTAFFGPSFNVDVGDVVLFGDEALKIPDTKNGSRQFKPRLFELVNKTLDLKTGNVIFDLVDTAYSTVDGRYGIFAPASPIGAGSTNSRVRIKTGFDTEAPAIEKDKWQNYIGLQILVHDDEWTYEEEVTLLGFDPADNTVMLVDPPLSFVPVEDDVVDIANYPQDPNPNIDEVYKRVFCFVNPSIDVVTGIDNTSFTVAPGDVSYFRVGAAIILHTMEWDQYSSETKILSVVGTTVTVEDDLGFTPDNTFIATLLGFPDDGFPYRYF